jgi:hypothetical protein
MTQSKTRFGLGDGDVAEVVHRHELSLFPIQQCGYAVEKRVKTASVDGSPWPSSLDECGLEGATGLDLIALLDEMRDARVEIALLSAALIDLAAADGIAGESTTGVPSRPSPLRRSSAVLLSACVVESQEVQELADLMVELGLVPHSHGSIECVAISATLPLLRDVTRFHEVGDDPLGRPLRDSHGIGDVTEPSGRVALQAQEHLGVAGEEVPVL